MAKGYTKIDNWLIEFLYSELLEHSELKVMLFLIRFTKCFKRDTVKASINYIAKGTCLSENTTRKALRGLINKGYVEILYKHCGSSPQILKVLYQEIEVRYPQSLRGDTLKDCRVNTTKGCTQEIKEEIKNINKKEEKASPSFFLKYINDFEPDEARRIVAEMTEEQAQEFLEGKLGVPV